MSFPASPNQMGVQTPKTFSPRIFSGIQPSGGLTLGNYLGALKRFVEKQDEGIETIYCLVDMHAITVWQDPAKLRQQTREGAAAFIAAGIDPARSILFNQSQVGAHAELAWIFNCVARMGWMGRMCCSLGVWAARSCCRPSQDWPAPWCGRLSDVRVPTYLG